LGASTSKKVVIERFDRPPLAGFANRNSYLTSDHVEILVPEGTFTTIALHQIKAVQFVRDFPPDNAPAVPWVFQARPKMNGLWVRLTFTDGEAREALIVNNLLELSATGLMVTPPNLAGNVMQAFIPRFALREISVLGVVGSPLRRPAPPKRTADQISLFGEKL
jgi:hypothetical protein